MKLCVYEDDETNYEETDNKCDEGGVAERKICATILPHTN